MNTNQQIAENIARIQGEIGGRARLLAATKTIPPETINFALDCGISLIGENRVNELLEKYEYINRNKTEIHFIGALQTNKVKYIIDKVDLIQSVDRESLALEIERQAAKHGIVMPILAEINIGGEESKSGITPEKIYEFCDFLTSLPHLRLKGLMAVPPKCEKSEDNREYFRKMSKIFIDISGKNVDNSIMEVLSLGMSNDYLTAVDCGSNLVRLGSAIFGARVYPAADR
ncbi:MAG: YggS family pyridoxal phosphate-dependent enzyme [Ruminococcaceae bacterium]|nr:YggS family pyridoxal phosphate-dependent enzyme [Oscillospiraceae bacterium]